MAVIINGLGQMKGWNSITCRILGRDVVGIRKVQYNDDQVTQNEYGAGKYPVGESQGNYSAAASIDLLDEEVRLLQSSLPPGKRLQDIEGFDVVVNYEQNLSRVTDIIHNCRFLNNGIEVNQGDGTIVRSFNLKTSHISHNV